MLVHNAAPTVFHQLYYNKCNRTILKNRSTNKIIWFFAVFRWMVENMLGQPITPKQYKPRFGTRGWEREKTEARNQVQANELRTHSNTPKKNDTVIQSRKNPPRGKINPETILLKNASTPETTKSVKRPKNQKSTL